MLNNSCNMELNGYDTYEKKDLKEIEKSLIKKYRKHLWAPFCRALKEFELIKDGDKIAICISGGKDSLLMAKLLQEFQKYGPVKFELVFLSMDPGFNDVNREFLEKNCEHLDIPVQILDSDIFEIVEKIAGDYPCFMCAKMRRGFLYAKAHELGCNKISLGHHFNDVIETVMLNVLYAGKYMSMMPKLKADNFEDMELIRPLYFIEEARIKTWSNFTGIPFMDCGCRVAAGKTSSKRAEVKRLIAELKKTNPTVDKSIFKSTYNVNLNTVIGWKDEDVNHSFLENFREDSE